MDVFVKEQQNDNILIELLNSHSGAIFDMDGTLLDSMKMWHTLDVQFLEKYGRKPEPDFQQTVAAMTLDVASAYIIEHYHIPLTPKQVANEFMQLVDSYYRNELQLKPGVLSLLQYIHKKGVSIMVATANEYDITYAALARTGALQYIQGIVTCTMAKAGKNSPAVYWMACEKMRKATSECLVFEDSLHAIKTAREGGFDVVAVYDDVAASYWKEICELTKCQVVF